MGVVLHVHNPFEPTERNLITVRRPMTIRRLVSRRRELRRHTSVRRVLGRRARDFVLPTVCFHNGKPVLRRDWSKTVVAAEDVVIFQALPAGGGGGSNPLQVVAVVAMIAIAVAAPYIAGPAVLGFASGTFGFALASAGIGLALSAAVYGVMSLFVQPPVATQGGDTSIASSPGASPTYNFQARGNTARLGQPIPELFGRHVVYPDYAHEPYVSFNGNEQYLHLLMVVTQGYCDFLETRIGETPTDNYPEIVWQKVEPGQPVDTAIVDPMMLTSHDMAEVELAGTEAGSPWYGPFIVNPPGTTITAIQIDYSAPQGLYFINFSAGLSPLNFTLQLDIQAIDDDGAPIGGWTTVDLIYQEEATRTPLRWTFHSTVGEARYQARVRRLDTKNGSASAAHVVYWTGLRGHMPGTRTFPGVTLWAVKARATGNLGSVNSKQFNVVAVRKLESWAGPGGGLTGPVQQSRDPCDAAAYICMAANAGRLTEQQVDLAGIYAHRGDYASRGWTFDAVFDTPTTCWEALSKIGRSIVAQAVVQGPRVRLVRDMPPSGPAMIFTPRNIARNSLELGYRFPDEKTADAIYVEYMDPRSWRWTSVLVSLPGSTTDNPTTMRLVGITNRKQAIYAGTMILRANKYRRREVRWGTEMEGLLLLYGDNVRLSHDMPAWGQSAEAIAWDASTRILQVSEPFTFMAGATHYVALRKRDGSMAGPYVAAEIAGNPRAVMLGSGDVPPLSLGGDAERTHIVFGPGETYARPLKVTSIIPRTVLRADVVAIDDDPRMYEPVPGV